MQTVLAIVVDSVRSSVALGLFVLLPIMCVMLAIMKVLQSRGVLDLLARLLSPATRVFGITGLSVIAGIQQLFVSFAAPPTTLAIMVQNKVSSREIAATLAMVLTMSQANATFPLAAVGLNIWITGLTSVLGGLMAASTTYYVFCREAEDEGHSADDGPQKVEKRLGIFRTAFDGAVDGGRLVLRSMPYILPAILIVNTVEAAGLFEVLESELTPALSRVGLPGISVLPVATKYLAGGTAMMGVTLDLIRDGTLTVVTLNQIAGFTINSLDGVGVMLLWRAVSSRPGVLKPAILGAIVGILVRGTIHLVVF